MGSFPHARRRQLAPLWRRGAAGAVDVALFVAYKSVALRVVGGEQAPRETATRLIALKEASQRGETVTPRAQREALRELVETLGGPTMPWTAWTLDMLGS